MTDTKTEHQPAAAPSLDRLVQEIDDIISGASDPQASQLGSALLAGMERSEKGDSYILVAIGSGRLAVSLEDVVEVGDLPVVTWLPNVPEWVLGIINVRGEIVSVVDLPRFLKWPVESSLRRGRMIILQHRGVKAAVQIENVLGMYRKTEQPEMVSGGPWLLGKKIEALPHGLTIDDQVFYVLDCRSLMTSERFTGVQHD
jgi:chemotaxis signal transduction protein